MDTGPAPDAGGEDAGDDAGPPPPPEPQFCDACRRDADCGEGALCLVLADGERGCGRACTTSADCADLPYAAECIEEVPGLPMQCAPASGTCVITDPGTPCTADADCEGRYDVCADADGLGARCTDTCRADADCPIGMRRCASTDAGLLCVRDEQPPAEQCAALVGLGRATACAADGSCPSGSTCFGSGELRLCLAGPPCAAGTALRESASGPVCVPTVETGTAADTIASCECVLADPGSLFDDALAATSLTRCDLHYPSSYTDLFISTLSHDPYRLSFTDRLVGDWASAPSFAREVASSLDVARTGGVSAAIERAAFFADLPIAGAEPPAAGALGDELEQLALATGATIDRATIDAEVARLDATVASKLAPIVAALRAAHVARTAAIARLEDPELWRDGPSAFFLDGLSRIELRRSDARGVLRGDVDVRAMAEGAAQLARAIEAADLRSVAGRAGDLTIETPIGRIAVRGGSTNHTYADAEWHETALLIDLGGADVYRFPAGANATVANGVAVVVDVGGMDTYAYDEAPHARDVGPEGHVRLPSDRDGRNDPAPGAMAGPSSLSRTARQGAGRLGIGLLFDLGAEGDRYRSLRMSQGYGALGVGVLYDAGGDDVYEAEAGSQGAAAFGVGLLIDASGIDRYVAYHASQGFAYARAVGALWDGAGADTYFMHPSDVLYWSPQDPGGSNSTIGQGAGFGRRADFTPDMVFMSGGLGVLRDATGDDAYTAGIFAQATGYWYGTGMLLDGAGNDRYDGQWYVQAGAAHFAAAVLLEEGGNDDYNAMARLQNVVLGGGHDFSISWLIDRGGADVYRAPCLSFGTGNEAGAGFFADALGDDTYTSTCDLSFGNASLPNLGDMLRRAVGTYGIFMDADGSDSYTRPTVTPVANDATWTQSRTAGEMSEHGAGVDRSGGRLGI